MKNLIKSILLLSIIFMTACNEDEPISPSEELNKKVSELIGTDLETPKAEDVQTLEWKCSNWDINFYKESEKVGGWNGFDKTIKDEEKNQVYRLSDGEFSVMGLTQQELKNSSDNSIITYKYTWGKDGELTINGIRFIVKMNGNNLVIYYEIKDAIAVSEIFNVSIDNTYGDALNDAEVEGLGVIVFIKRDPTDNQQNADMTTQELIEDYLAQNEIKGAKYLGIKTDGGTTIILDKGNKPAVAIKFEYMGGIQLSNQRAESLFNALISGDSFFVLDYDIDIARISFEGDTKTLFKVEGYTQLQEKVSFLYDISKDEQSWVVEPSSSSTNTILAYDLVQKFHDRTALFGKIYNLLLLTNDSYTFVLGDPTEGEGSKEVMVTNQQIELSDIAPERAKTLFTAFMTKSEFVFKDVQLKLDSISHEDGSGSSFIVAAEVMQTEERVRFYYNTKTGNQHWLIAPEGTNSTDKTIDSYTLVQNFIDGKELFGGIYSELAFSDGKWMLKGDNSVVEFEISGNIELYQVVPEGAISIFRDFLNNDAYDFNGFDINISSIKIKDGDEFGFNVKGYTVSSQEEVEFYINLYTYEDNWIKEPSTSYPVITSYDLVQKFNDRSEILGVVYNQITPTSDPYTFDLDNSKMLTIKDQTIDLSNVTPVRAKELYETFLKGDNFTFENTILKITRIDHESGNGGSLIVRGKTTNTEEEVRFYYDTNSDKQHWLDAPGEQ